jgi:hypothetical protein
MTNSKYHFRLFKSTHRFINHFGIITLCLLVVGSCKKELKAPNSIPLETGTLTSSKDTVIINSASPADEAVTFSWDAIANSLISYTIVISANSKSDTTKVAQNSVSKKFSNAELNNIAVEKLGLAIGTLSELQVVVNAQVAINGKTAESNAIKVKIEPAPTGAAYSALWIVGDATPNGWDINNPNEFVKDPTNSFQFKYNEVLKVGEFKIPVTTGNWNCDYFMPPTNGPDISSTEVELIAGGTPDNKWKISTAGAYKILLNISSSPFIKITPFTPYAKLWIVGDATPAGWDIDAPTPMTTTPENPYEFSYEGTLNVGEFKIPVTTGDWNTDYFMPLENGEGISAKYTTLVKGGNPDYKWKIAEAGKYKITINQLKETISVVKI